MILTKPYTVISLIVLLLLTACGGGDGGSSNSSSSPQPRVWQPNGGNATIPYDSYRPFLTIIPNLDINQISGVSQGRELFITNWTPSGQGRPLFDGLGALFNAPSCTSCHASSGRVPPYLSDGRTTAGVLFRLGDKQGNPHPIWGVQLQSEVINNSVGLFPEGRVTVSENMDKIGENFVTSLTFNLTHQPSQSLGTSHLGARIAPHLVGMGLLDLVPESAIIANADPDDKNQDGISGRVHWVHENHQKLVGRFGWKAINASLRTQNATAMHQDMGLTTSIHPNHNCTDQQILCKSMEQGGTPEVSDDGLQAVVDFMTALSVPDRRIENITKFNQGADIFEQIGCHQCHQPTLQTGNSHKFKELSNQTIYAYTDLLLHDMGKALDDGVKELNAESYEWRTPPLWGIGIVAKQPNARFLHDGRAKTIKEAILWHGGEAQKANDQFQKLSKTQQESLLEFLHGI